MIKRVDVLSELGLRPKMGTDLSQLFHWLADRGYTDTAGVFDVVHPEDVSSGAIGDELVASGFAMALATSRRAVQPLRQDQLKDITKRYAEQELDVDQSALWEAHKQPRHFARALAWARIPADAMAFYRPFHFPPFNQWGIYLLVGPLLAYYRRLADLNPKLKLLPADTLLHLVLFEVFHHEFFHHLVESAATTLEIVLAAHGVDRAIYLPQRTHAVRFGLGHPHAPVEEALANAYAYNSLSFISRVKVGFKSVAVRTYQKAVQGHWHLEPAGYRDAGAYIGGDYVPGAASLLSAMFGQANLADDVPLSIIARHVMPNGFAAFVAKPEIPTWLVGSERELADFTHLVPAPNEAYTQLFWPYNTSKVDASLRERVAAEKAKKAAAKDAATATTQ
jgi:hypothetical protein